MKRKDRNTQSPSPAERLPSLDRSSRVLSYTSLLRLASGVLRAASSVPWNGGPAGDGRSSCSRDPRRGGELPSSATFLGGRDWEKRSLETAAPWTLAGLADWSPEGTEERRAPCNAVYTALPQRACPHQSWALASGLPQKPSNGNDGPQTHVISKASD